MSRSIEGIVSATCLVALAACTSLPPRESEAIGPPYNEQVKEAYLELAERGPNKPRFYQKAVAAFQGDRVWPEPVGSWDIAPELRPEAHRLRERLVTLLEAGAGDDLPLVAADTVAGFDCWMQYEELAYAGRAPTDPGCRELFLTGLGELEESVVDVPPAYLVFFEPGRSELDIRDIAVIEDAARMAALAEAESVAVVGFADPSGSSAANQRLSNQRAETVAQALVEMGLPAEALTVTGEGAVAAEDAAESRRVEIRLQI